MNTVRPVDFLSVLRKTSLQRGSLFAFILLGALLMFEIFNFSTTDYALSDLLGTQLKFMGMRWATILSIAFCGIDFAGIARLFTPEQGRDEPVEVWYLFGAWVLAAAMNAALTWWGVSIAIVNSTHQSAAILSGNTLTKVVPVFVAVMVWVIRILIIGTFSVAGERIFSMADERSVRPSRNTRPQTTIQRPTTPAPVRPSPKPTSVSRDIPYAEPSYHPAGMTAKPNNNQNQRY